MSGDFQIGEWRVQPAVNRLTRNGQVARLEPKVMQVLVCLAERAGEVVTREELIGRVWSDVFVTDDVLHRAIRELRRVFGDSPSAPAYIETIRKRGYRLIPATSDPDLRPQTVTSDPDLRPQIVTSDPDLRPHPPSTAAGWRFSLLAASVALTIAAAVVIVAMRADDLVPQAHARFVPLVSGPLNESDPAMSPDGRRLAFVQREPGESTSADIYVRDLADGQIARITTDPASDRMPAWSFDGSRLAFVRITPSSCDIFVRELSIGREVRVAPCGNIHEPKVAWTSTGDALIMSQADASRVTSGWRIARMDLATGITTSLIDPPPGLVGDHSPAVSPNGRALAFIRRQSGGVSDIYVASVDGTNLRRITFDDADLTGLDWTGDGRSIVYSSDRAGGYSLWRVAAAGGTATLLAGGAARMKHPVSDRASRRIVYENWNYEINIWQVGQGREPAVITRSSELWNLYPQISPDGRQLAYVSTESGGHELWIADRDGAHARQLTRAGGGVKSPRWSPDGRRIVFLARHQSAVDVQYVDLSTGDIVPVTADMVNEVAPAWSHDGERVLYGAPDRDGRWNVWSVNASAPSPPRLEVANAVAAQAAADGSAWYFTRADQPGLWRTAANSRTSVERVLDTVATGDALGWTVSRDGLYFVAVQNDTVRLHRAPLMGGPSVEIATLAQSTWPGFSLTPDGGVLYARWDRRDSNLMSIEF